MMTMLYLTEQRMSSLIVRLVEPTRVQRVFLVASVLLIFFKFFCVDISFIRNRIDIDIVLLETVVVFNATFNNISAISSDLS
jgi:hypothetical protein